MRNRTPQGAEKDLAKAGLDPVDRDRRKALKALGQFAVYVSPAMTVLLPGEADAHHKPSHTANCPDNPSVHTCSAF
jgi:hypothetical protein